VICVNDFMAFGVLKELRESGLRVPEEVSVTGYDNIRLSEFVYPPLTTVNIPRAEIGHTAFQALVPSEEETPSHGREFRINPELVIRETTGPTASGHL
jgi:LacI family transcriptional regulator, galactose operon repressor